VDRLHCRGTTYDVDLVLGKPVAFENLFYLLIKKYTFSHLEDINSELFALKRNDRVAVAFAR
jgi:hypothetical protein